ncbi:ankyrin repeat domain-containing protein [Agrobacterium fabrum]|jgi:ankyrin repeat protein|uniref:Ankyrin repeat n=1 Tax=Agrobacterium fabrum TaxID=1176649 RepID=A0A7Z7BHR7_9HYPH|nr:ankyrin repeat domain-containing protein [Agrobacterium fabrum]MCR6724740.1 ankyrin repeat domain-containing protein [Agrobacterium fabrum]UXT57494.1 ankyrin repeat domain-containing protein [Agrobacterium fabrum]WCK75131.1 ankyrin repeat domain-containing protein [Agrobacterium fabrum]WIE26212.1 ankyrin repeat domain-containing protein [Agrobacterium fabrum]WIE42169.1 ankyrin repeat domain-containing protein [Agrobacterium fabrum]
MLLRWSLIVLLTFGLSLDSAAATDTDAVGAFHHAVQVGDVQTIRTMIAADPGLATSRDKFGFQPIHLLDMYPEEEVLNLLLKNGADINAANDEGVTILHIITDPDTVSLLVKRGANIEARDERGWTPLIMQANNQQNGPDVVAALLAQGADPNAEGFAGETALSFAKQTGDAALVRMLIASGAKN